MLGGEFIRLGFKVWGIRVHGSRTLGDNGSG